MKIMSADDNAKVYVENELREMNELLMLVVQKPDSSIKFHRDIIALLRDMASIRVRMLANSPNKDASLDTLLKNEIAQHVIKTRSFLYSTGQCEEITAKKSPPSPCAGPLM
jgi:hypothetical protein